MFDVRTATDIEILEWLKECHTNTDFPSEVRVVEAYDNAIKALKEKEAGKKGGAE